MNPLDYRQWPTTSKSIYGSIKLGPIPPRPSSILITGMGGSGIVGDVLRDYLGGRIPIHVVKDLTVPDWVDASTLTIAISYSGNTSETICSSLRARERGGSAVIGGVTTGGGIMASEFRRLGIQVVQVPTATAPRFAFRSCCTPRCP